MASFAPGFSSYLSGFSFPSSSSFACLFLGLFPESFAFSLSVHCPGQFHRITSWWLSDLYHPPRYLLGALEPLIQLPFWHLLLGTSLLNTLKSEVMIFPPSNLVVPYSGMITLLFVSFCLLLTVPPLSRLGSQICLHTGIIEKLLKKMLMPESHPTEIMI